MTHPLTDEMIVDRVGYAGIRQRYTPAVMRIAADWQLEQVIEWLNFGYQSDPNLSREMKHRGGFDEIAIALEKAMRPQIVDLPQANSDVCGEEGMKRALQRTIEENTEAMRMLADS